jgi:phosphonate transport system substrate-binding protein
MSRLRAKVALALIGAGTLMIAAPGLKRAIAAEPPPRELRVVFIAYENPTQLVEDVRPVVAYLTKQLGIPVKHFVATDYAGVVEALRARRADMGFMGPLQYVMAHQQAGAYPILGELYNGKPSYVSRIYVRKASGIQTLADLRGKTIAFTDPLSSSGYMYPLDLFKRAGLVQNADSSNRFFRRVYFAGGDEQALRAVLNGFADAAGIGQYAITLLPQPEREKLTTIAQTPPMPSHCVVVRKDLNPQTVARLQAALFALNKGPNRKLLAKLYNVDGYVKVTHATYADVERVAREYGFAK